MGRVCSQQRARGTHRPTGKVSAFAFANACPRAFGRAPALGQSYTENELLNIEGSAPPEAAPSQAPQLQLQKVVWMKIDLCLLHFIGARVRRERKTVAGYQICRPILALRPRPVKELTAWPLGLVSHVWAPSSL